MSQQRLLITGSRTWDDEDVIGYWLNRFSVKWEGQSLTLISGSCPRGADEIAERLAVGYGFQVEKYPADWETHGKSAGFLRNAYMVRETNPTWCVAFIRDNSKGATMCRDLAKRYGVPTKTVLWKETK